MQKIILLIVIMALTTTITLADAPVLCSDTDNGGIKGSDAALTVKGSVKYGIRSESDVCVTGKDGVSTTSPSAFLREYFCENDQRKHEDYDCIKLGHQKCEAGACVSSGNLTATQQQAQKAAEKISKCGNQITDKKENEDCDPPNSICFNADKQYGLCSASCTCKIATASKKGEPVCGDGSRGSNEECEADTDCPTNFVCSSCNCVKQLTPQEIEAMKQQAAPKPIAQEEKTTTATAPPKSEEKIDDLNLEEKDFEEDSAIKATSSITNFFKGVFNWIVSLFT